MPARKTSRKGRPAASSVAATPRRSPFRIPLSIAGALIALNLAVYAPVRHFEFVNWDDTSYITENPNVRDGLTWHSVEWALTTGYSPYWHPVTWLSHLLDVELYGLEPGPHHVTNLVIHIANTLLLFTVLRRMTGADGRSAFVAALFAVHPLHVESVVWIAERKDVLSTFFWALTLLAYASYVARPQPRRYIAVLVCYALALMAKPMVVTLPLLLLLLDAWPLRRVEPEGGLRAWRALVVEKIPLVALAVATSLATFVIQKRVGAVAGLDVLPWRLRIENATVGYVGYVWKTIWPVRLAAFYPFHAYPLWRVAGAAVCLVAATVVAIRYRRRRPYVTVGWLWFVVTVAPVIGLVQAGEQAMADRFTYVPMIGLLLIVSWGVPDLLSRWRAREAIVAVGAVLVVAACAVTARAQVMHWQDSVTLWRHATDVTPDSYIAFENLGQALRERGQLDEAQANYRKALERAPGGSPIYLAMVRNAMGLVATRQGNVAEALSEFSTAVGLNPNFAEAQSNLGNALATEKRFSEAIEHYRAAVRLKPDFTEAQVGLGGALLGLGRAAEAIPHYREALRLSPDLAQVHNGLGAALATEGRDQDAMTEYMEALRLKPDLATAHLNVALLLVKRGQTAEARRQLEQALAADPGYEPARQLLARLER